MRVKCPRCGARFGLRVERNRAAVAGTLGSDEAKPDGGGKHWPPAADTAGDAPFAETPSPAGEAPPERLEIPTDAPSEPMAPPQRRDDPIDAPPEPTDEDLRIVIRRAQRLSRALVLDMINGRRERRDKALAEGCLLLEFGEEIRKSWEIYAEKVGPEIARNTSYFRDALNEILADGRRLF